MLFAEGDANDGNAKQRSEEDVHQTGPKSAEDYPKDVERNADAAD